MEDVNTQENEREQSFRSRIMAARQAADIKKKAQETVKNKIMSPVSQASKNVLRWAWFSLIPSFGLSLIYINMHVFLRWVFPNAFCKLGDEWVPKIAGTGEHSAKNVAGTAFGIIEITGLFVIDFLLVFLFFCIFAVLSTVINIAINPLDLLS